MHVTSSWRRLLFAGVTGAVAIVASVPANAKETRGDEKAQPATKEAPAASKPATPPATQPATKPDSPPATPLADQPTTQPTSRPAADEELIVTVVAVKRLVQARISPDDPWRPAKVGMKLPQGAEFRTGPKSQVVFFIPPNQTIALDRLGTIQIIQAIREHGKIKTDLGMKYGRTVYNIEKAGIEHDAKIHMPGSTLSVRGSRVGAYSHGSFQQVWVSTGTGTYQTGQKQAVTMSQKSEESAGGDSGEAQTEAVEQDTDGFSGVGLAGDPAGIGMSVATDANTNPADLAITTQNLNDNTFTLDDTEQTAQWINPGLNPGGGLGGEFFGSSAGRRPPRNFGLVQGTLNIMVTGIGNGDVDYIWDTPNNFKLCTFLGSDPACLRFSRDGGEASNDDQVPPIMEFVRFLNGVPVGDHTGTAQLVVGNSTVTVDVFRDGMLMQSFTDVLDDNGQTEASHTITIPPRRRRAVTVTQP